MADKKTITLHNASIAAEDGFVWDVGTFSSATVDIQCSAGATFEVKFWGIGALGTARLISGWNMAGYETAVTGATAVGTFIVGITGLEKFYVELDSISGTNATVSVKANLT